MSNIADYINAIVDASHGIDKSAEPGRENAYIPKKLGVGTHSKFAPEESSQGIDSPLTEQTRQHNTVNLAVPLGASQIALYYVTQITARDKSNREVVFDFKLNPALQPPP
jgi:hypothetical protein